MIPRTCADFVCSGAVGPAAPSGKALGRLMASA
jgi:hypothetical protein